MAVRLGCGRTGGFAVNSPFVGDGGAGAGQIEIAGAGDGRSRRGVARAIREGTGADGVKRTHCGGRVAAERSVLDGSECAGGGHVGGTDVSCASRVERSLSITGVDADQDHDTGDEFAVHEPHNRRDGNNCVRRDVGEGGLQARSRISRTGVAQVGEGAGFGEEPAQPPRVPTT